MSQTTNDGGPAFPDLPIEHAGYWYNGTTGMSLRDYFAAKAMTAILTHKDAFENAGETAIARMAYNQADAMLEARSEGGEA